MKIQVDAAGGIGQYHAPNPAPAQFADSEDHLGRGIAFVKMRAAGEHDHARRADPSGDEFSGVPGRGRRRPFSDLGVGSFKAIFKHVRECAQTASEYDADPLLAHIVVIHETWTHHVVAHSRTPAMQADMKLA